MSDDLTDRQKINAELAARTVNKRNSKILKDHIPPEEQADLKILFNCECADPDCSERLPMTMQEYDEIHNKSGHFIVAKGHVEPSVEKLKSKMDDVAVVEKYSLS